MYSYADYYRGQPSAYMQGIGRRPKKPLTPAERRRQMMMGLMGMGVGRPGPGGRPGWHPYAMPAQQPLSYKAVSPRPVQAPRPGPSSMLNSTYPLTPGWPYSVMR